MQPPTISRSSPSDASIRRSLALAGAIFAVAVVPFLPGLRGAFNFDDVENLVDNAHFRGPLLPSLGWSFTAFHMGHWQPLVWISCAIDARIWGAATPFGYLLTNLGMHAASAVVVFLLARRLIGRAVATASPAPSPGLVTAAAVAAALLFAVHPMRVETVSWATERRSVQGTLLFLLALLAWLRALERADATGGRPRQLASLLLFAAGLLSHVIVATLPAVLLILDAWPLRRSEGRPGRWKTLVVEKLPWFALALAAVVVAHFAQIAAGAMLPLSVHGVVPRIAQASYGLGFYLWKSLWPVNLSAMYELRLPLDPTRIRYVASIVGVALAGTIVVMRRRRWPALATAAAIHLVVVFPVLGFVQCGRQEVADRYSYLPSIAWAILIGGTLARFLCNSGKAARIAAATLVGVVVMTLGTLTWKQASLWQSPLALWQEAAAATPPSAFAHYNYGCELSKNGDRPAAIDEFRRSIAIDPRYVEPHFNLGNALREDGRSDEALAEFESAARADPTATKAWWMIATIESDRKQVRVAEHALRVVTVLEPDAVEPRHRLSRLLFDSGRVDDAIVELAELTRRHPELPEEHYNLGCALAARERLDEAAHEYHDAIRLRPDLVVARLNLADVLSREGRRDEAIAELQEVLRREPENALARHDLDELQHPPARRR